jgi:hypothetical protein
MIIISTLYPNTYNFQSLAITQKITQFLRFLRYISPPRTVTQVEAKQAKFALL